MESAQASDAPDTTSAYTPPGEPIPFAAAQANGTSARSWQHELPRWLATLNPGRTRIEYEKALHYFFDTPGVPSVLADLTFDLLLAYRGSLALRAAPRSRGAVPPRATRPAEPTPMPALPTMAGVQTAALPAGNDAEGQGTAPASPTSSAGPLAPATVNIRLTALRQFLAHCALLGLLSDLPPDRIRSALRRLSIERHRPYQILAEPEWDLFLRTALAPACAGASPNEPSLSGQADTLDAAAPPAGPRGPWGLSRAERAERRAAAEGAPARPAAPTVPIGQTPRPIKSRAGLTGARTAQRDHALLALALATGLRAIELALLDLGDLTREWHDGREEWWLVLPDAKTKGQRGGRTLPLSTPLVETLLASVHATGRRWERPADRDTPLFLSTRGQSRSLPTPSSGTSNNRLTTRQIERIVDRVEQQWRARDAEPSSGFAGEARDISPHSLRHSTAIALLEGNVSLRRDPASVEHVRGWLGHFDIRTTQGYLAHLDARHARRPMTLSISSPDVSSSSAQMEASEKSDSGATNPLG
jgi:integrase